MVDNGSSQVQQTAALWHGLMNEHLARVEAYGNEVSKVRDQGIAQAKLAASESAKLLQAWVEYGSQLTTDFQKLALEGAKRGLELLRPQV
jgi:hypothetical protein